MDRQSSDNQAVSPAFLELLVMDMLMHELTVRSPEILCPLVFNMNQRPLAAAESKVLQPRKLEPILLWPTHPIRWHVTPVGSADSSTVT